jgi:N-acetylmuramoyl-L-alanine amidase
VPLSPNFGPRRGGARPSLIVLHYTAMACAKAAIARLCDPSAEVSAHYVISRCGEITQLVPEHMRAWHAGAGAWAGCTDVNSHSIGVELDNDGASPFSEPLMCALEQLMPQIMQRHGISPEGVIGHSDMAPGRKCDPGAKFDWLRLERQGLAAKRSYGHCAGDMQLFRQLAQRKGYTAEVDAQTLLEAVRLRYRPWARGALAPADIAALTPPPVSG